MLLDRYMAALVLYARQLCSDPEDAVQIAFIKLSSQADWPEDCGAWLYKVVRNEALQQTRGDRRRRDREAAFAQLRTDWFTPDPASGLDTAQAMASLERLSRCQREIVTARIWGGLAFREIAQLVDVPLSTAHREYQQAITQLQTELNKPCHTNNPTKRAL